MEPKLVRPLRTLPVFLLVLSAACGDDPAPTAIDGGTKPPLDVGVLNRDASVRLDSGVTPDAEVADVPTIEDAGFPDATEPADVGGEDGSVGMDVPASPDATAPMDATANPDATPPPVDAGPPPLPDMDGDFISDADEGNGLIDVDSDGTPDASDTDSDGDGIPDSVEAGDQDTHTPPVDTDMDGTPDFRDRDSDGDGIFDAFEGTADPDLDGVPAYLDDDSDGDGIPDREEGSGDLDMDGVRNFLDTDSDGDTLTDAVEGTADPDGDGQPNYLDTDSDGDGIDDRLELDADADGDQIPNYLDLDSDGDGVDDRTEGSADPDGDMIGNWLDDDSDGDTIADRTETSTDTDRDGIPNFLDLDSDQDTLTDASEAGDANVATPPRDSDFDGIADYVDFDSDNDTIWDGHEGTADTDNDGLPDRYDIDSDNDSILDNVEAGRTSTSTPPVDTDGDMIADFRDPDADGDTILDIVEGTDDVDMDMVPNFRDLDSDGDTWTDAVEAGDTDPTTAPVNTDSDRLPDYLDTDSDADGLADRNEPGCPAGPDRLQQDSDNDTFPDPAEVAFGSDPCSSMSIIDDFFFTLPPGGPMANAPLVFNRTNIDKADMAINMDTTGSMAGEIANLRTSLSNTIIPQVRSAIPDLGVAVSSFEDYPISPFGTTLDGDLPFRLGTRVTTRSTDAQAAVNRLTTRNGVDIPESGIESLYQIATGAGTSWSGGSVAAFNPATGNIPGVADGTIGGVGFRDNALPIIVHVTDAPSHTRSSYRAVNTTIQATETTVVDNAISGIGARVVTLANTRLALEGDPFTAICDGSRDRVFGHLSYPVAGDVDWFVLQGATAGQTVSVETFAWRLGAGVDTLVGIFNASGTIATNDDISGSFDSRATGTLSGTGPYYVAITSFGDGDFNATGAQTAGWYFADIRVGNQPFVTSPTQCRNDDANGRSGATPLVASNVATQPASVAACKTACEQHLPQLAMPEGMALSTRAVIPPCAWDVFGGGRPAGCAANQCCTGLNGAGRNATAPNGQCPLSFQIDSNGSGLGSAVVSAIQALVNFSAFTITTNVRPDPAELASSGIDTRCFIHGVIPTQATPPNSCAPQPTAVDLIPPTPELDSWQNVAPGTTLEFDVRAINQDRTTMNPCAPSQTNPQLFRAFIDVVADGVTVVDTRDVIIIVPPLPPTGSN